MKSYKVCVYAIAKNESKFVKRWVESMKEADAIYVLDTGSTDATVEELRRYGVHVKEGIIDPWRFDVARNISLDMLPDDVDICVCTDLDECFEAGWRKKLEKSWSDNTSRARYLYHWSFDEAGNPEVSFLQEKIHKRKGYIWKHPVHEVLEYQEKIENVITIDTIILNHYPDYEKTRTQYLPLLELSVEEDPDDDRNLHYLGREYMYYHRWNDCIDTLIRHLKLKTSVWRDERSASMRFIARSYIALGRYDEARMWLEKAMKEAPYLRDPYVERALLEAELENWKQVEFYCKEALKIKTCQQTYINEPFSWNHTIYDLLSLSSYYQEDYSAALQYIAEALQISPNNRRLIQNKKLIEEKISKK